MKEKLTKKKALLFTLFLFCFSVIFLIWTFIICPHALLMCLASHSTRTFKVLALTPTIANRDALDGGVFNATIVHENRECFLFLINRADLAHLDGWGVSPLHIAAHMPNGQYYIEELLAQGADVNLIDEHGRSPLDVAIEFEYKDNIRTLRNAGGVEIDPSVGAVRGM